MKRGFSVRAEAFPSEHPSAQKDPARKRAGPQMLLHSCAAYRAVLCLLQKFQQVLLCFVVLFLGDEVVLVSNLQLL